MAAERLVAAGVPPAGLMTLLAFQARLTGTASPSSSRHSGQTRARYRHLGRLVAAPQDDRVAHLPVGGLGGVRPPQHRVGGEQALGTLLGELAQPGGLVDWIADDRVLEALLGADVARH